MRRLSRFEQSWRDWVLLARAVLWLSAVDLGLKMLGFDRLREMLADKANPNRAGSLADRQVPLDRIERVLQLVQMAARHHVSHMGCLTQALTAQKLLALEGAQTDLRIGVRKTGKRLDAHAWIEYQGCPVGERADVRDSFAVMSSVHGASSSVAHGLESDVAIG